MKSAGRAPSLRVIAWQLPYNWGKSMEKPRAKYCDNELPLFVVCFLLGNYPASGFYMPTFRNTLSHFHKQVDMSRMLTSTCLWRWNRQCVPKRRHIKSRRQVITQKKAYNIQNRTKAWNQELTLVISYDEHSSNSHWSIKLVLVIVNQPDWRSVNFMDLFSGSMRFKSYVIHLSSLSFLMK